MWTPGLKKRLIEKIRRTEDPVVLEEAYRLLEIETEDLDVYKLNDEQKSAVREASLKSFLTYILLLPVILFTSSCSGAGSSPSEIAFVGSTPGDELIKSMLTLHPATMVDFIRWNLTLNDTKPDKNTFILSILFGEAQPNTLGFKGGGEKALFKGEFTVSKNENKNINGEIYHLKSSQLPSGISMVKLNDNLFHILTPHSQLMIGNGGWSYTLNRKEPINSLAVLPALTTSSTLTNDTSLQVVFDGRTPARILLLNIK